MVGEYVTTDFSVFALSSGGDVVVSDGGEGVDKIGSEKLASPKGERLSSLSCDSVGWNGGEGVVG